MKPNPPIRGHELMFEGHAQRRWSHSRNEWAWFGGCRCGEKPPGFPNLSTKAVKAWHREHKAELRGEPTKPDRFARLIEAVEFGMRDPTISTPAGPAPAYWQAVLAEARGERPS